jgi:hypothetical protein
MKHKTVEIIVHCYAVAIPDFAKMLTAQLSSILQMPPKCGVCVSVCTSAKDELTQHVVQQFSEAFHDAGDSVSAWLFDETRLFRRAIARNQCALATKADVVWFADADYLCGEGALDAMAKIDFQSTLAFPRHVFIHRSHAMGDRELARIIPGEMFLPDLSIYEQRTEKFAIGGLQIVSGFTARTAGYLDRTKWVEPVKADRFLDTKEDKAFRAKCGSSAAVDIPNLYRMRHSQSAFEDPAKRLAQTAGKE